MPELLKTPEPVGATLEARFLIAAFCRLAKLLSYSEHMRWLVGAVGIESTNRMETKEFCGAAWPSKVLTGKERNC